MQEIDNILEKTKQRIHAVDAPDYLLTRAKQQFENLKEVATPRFLWTTSMATVILVAFNVYVIGQRQASDVGSYETESYDELMMPSSNQLYADE